MKKKKADIKFIREILRTLLLMVVPFIMFCVVLNFHEDFATLLIRQFADTKLFYASVDISVFNLIFYIFFILSLLLFGALVCSAYSRSPKSFVQFISEKNHKNLIVMICLFVSSIITLLCFFPMCEYNFVADDKSYKHSSLFQKDETVFDYNSVDSVKIYVYNELDAKAGGSLYRVYIDVSVGNKTYTLIPDGFGNGFCNHFKNMYGFLSNFDANKITFDTTDVEHAFKSSKEQDKYLQLMIDEYS